MRDDLIRRLGIELPLVQAPMAGAQDEALAIAVANAGGLGSLPCAMLSSGEIRAQVAAFRAASTAPMNLNFFCHHAAPAEEEVSAVARWRAVLEPFYLELGVTSDATAPVRRPFDEASCALVEELRPEVVSFHFGLPERSLLERVRRVAKVLGSATLVEEARFLDGEGCDAIIAQGAEAGGHRGMFLAPITRDGVAAQVGTFALLPQVVDAVKIPVIAAGGIGDGRGVAAAFALGASGVQVGTAFLRCPEARIRPAHRAALARARDDGTRLTNVLTGRPARSLENRVMRDLGAMRDDTPPFPLAAGPLAPLRAASEATGSGDFSPLWSGQAAALARETDAASLTRALVRDAERILRDLAR